MKDDIGKGGAAKEDRACKEEQGLDQAQEVRPEEQGQEGLEIEALQKRVAELESEMKETRDRYLRSLADLDNARKRVRHEMAEAQVQAAAGILRDILQVVDNFERALETSNPRAAAPTETRAVYDGISLIYRQLLEMLARWGVKPMTALGQPFDPRLHEAVAQVPVSDDQEDGVVALELQKGYLFGDRVLRPSKVGVGARETEDEQAREGNDPEAGKR